MRSEIHRWIKQCLYYQLTFRWRRQRQEIMFSWLVSSPFAILYVDLWMSGKYTDSKGNMALMKVMRDIYPSSLLLCMSLMNFLLPQLIIFLSCVDEVWCVLSRCSRWWYPIQRCLCCCKYLDLNYGMFPKCNHKGLSITHFHRFLNKSTTIAMEDRQCNDFFHSYWNSRGVCIE